MAIEKPLVDGNVKENGKELSKEELDARRAEITKYYEEHIPSLKVQLEYEGLLRDIEKVRAERLQAQMFMTKAMAEPPTAPAAPGRPNPQAGPMPAPPNAAKKVAKEVEKTVKDSNKTKKKGNYRSFIVCEMKRLKKLYPNERQADIMKMAAKNWNKGKM